MLRLIGFSLDLVSPSLVYTTLWRGTLRGFAFEPLRTRAPDRRAGRADSEGPQQLSNQAFFRPIRRIPFRRISALYSNRNRRRATKSRSRARRVRGTQLPNLFAHTQRLAPRSAKLARTDA